MPCTPFSENLLFKIDKNVGDAQKALEVATRYGNMANTVMSKVGGSLENPSGMLADLSSGILPTIPPLPSVNDIINCPAAQCMIPGAEQLAGLPSAQAQALAQQLLDEFTTKQRATINAAVQKNIKTMMNTPLGMLTSMQKGLDFALKSLGVGSQITNEFSSIIDCMSIQNPAMVNQMRSSGALDAFDAAVALGDPQAVPGLESTLASAKNEFDTMLSQHVSDVSDFIT